MSAGEDTIAELDLTDLGEEIRLSRQYRRLTQQQVADAAGITRTHVVAIEAGTAPMVAFQTILRVMRIVGLDLRTSTYNRGRPTLEDVQAENDAEDEAERAAQAKTGWRPRAR